MMINYLHSLQGNTFCVSLSRNSTLLSGGISNNKSINKLKKYYKHNLHCIYTVICQASIKFDTNRNRNALIIVMVKFTQSPKPLFSLAFCLFFIQYHISMHADLCRRKINICYMQYMNDGQLTTIRRAIIHHMWLKCD